MATRKSGCGRWTQGHFRVLRGGRHVFPELGNWALGGVSNRKDALEPTFDVPPSIWSSIETAWRELRREIMATWTNPASRPWAWWVFDAPEPRNPQESEDNQLARLGLQKKGKA